MEMERGGRVDTYTYAITDRSSCRWETECGALRLISCPSLSPIAFAPILDYTVVR